MMMFCAPNPVSPRPRSSNSGRKGPRVVATLLFGHPNKEPRTTRTSTKNDYGVTPISVSCSSCLSWFTPLGERIAQTRCGGRKVFASGPGPVARRFNSTGCHDHASRPPQHRHNQRHAARKEGDRAQANALLCRRNPLGNRPRRKPNRFPDGHPRRATPIARIPTRAKNFTTSTETIGHNRPRLRHEGQALYYNFASCPSGCRQAVPSRGSDRCLLDRLERDRADIKWAPAFGDRLEG